MYFFLPDDDIVSSCTMEFNDPTGPDEMYHTNLPLDSDKVIFN